MLVRTVEYFGFTLDREVERLPSPFAADLADAGAARVGSGAARRRDAASRPGKTAVGRWSASGITGDGPAAA